MLGPGDPTAAAAGGPLTQDLSRSAGFRPDSSSTGPSHCGGGNSDLERLVRLFTDEDTAEITERQLVVLRQVCKIREKGFRYGDLPLVERLLPIVSGRVTPGHHASEFRQPLLKLIQICSLAPVRDRAHQEFTERGLTASSSLFRVLGRLLWSPDAGIQAATADALRKVAAGNDPTRPNTPDNEKTHRFGGCRDDLRPKPKDVNQALLLGCGVVTSTVACLGMVMGDVLASLNELDADSSLRSSSFGDDDTDPLGSVDELVQPGSDLEAGSLPLPHGDGDLHYTEGVDLEEDEGVDSTATNAQGDGLMLQDTEAGGGRRASSSNLAVKRAVLVSLLQLVRELSTNANSSTAMVEEGLVALLVQVIQAVRGIRDPTLSISVEVMWNCLEHSQNAMDNGPPAKSRASLIRKARKSNAAFALSSWNGVLALRDTVEALLIGGFRNKDKELRNEAVIVASQLLRNGRSHPLFRSTGMLLLILRYATAIETGLADGNPLAAESEARTFSLAGTEGSHSGGIHNRARTGVPELGPLANPRNFATTTEVDMELKLLWWSMLADLCKRDTCNVEVVHSSPLMETLLMYMDLVIEEGQSGDVPPPGMSRSISLASTQFTGNGQMNSSKASGSTTPTLCSAAGGGDSKKSPSAAGSELGGKDGPSAALTLSCAPISGDHPPMLSVSGSELRSESKSEGLNDSEHHGTEVSRRNSTKEQCTPSTGGGVTQIFVPASVFRLPVTSIQLLQGQAMATLLVLAPKCPEKFQALGGHMVTLHLLDRLGSRPDNQRLVKVATKLLATVVGVPGLKEELGRVDGVRIMLDRFSDEWKREQHGGSSEAGGGSVGVGRGSGGHSGGGGGNGGGEGAGDVRTDTVIILCRLCEESPENQKAFRKADGVPTMMAAVKAYCRARSEAKQREGVGSGRGRGGGWGGGGGSDGGAGASGGSSVCLRGSAGEMESGSSGGESLDPSLIHIIDCIWCAVVGNRRSEARLLQCEGLDTLLDLLELCPVFMRHQVTGILADLLRNKRSIPYARAWRSDLNMLSITQLMVRLWVSEESRLGVSRPNGILQNLWEPLQSHDRGHSRRSSLKKASARRVRSRPTTGETTNGPNMSMASDDNTAAVDALLSRTSTGSSSNVHAVPLDEAAGNPLADDVLTGAAVPPTRMRETEDALGLTGAPCGVCAAQDASGKHASAAALALKAGKRAVTVEQGGRGGGQKKRASQVGVEASVAKAMMHLDLRGKIAAVLGMVGLDGSTTAGLDPSDLKASYMATSYMDFRAGEAWQGVAAELEAQHTNPIAADALVLDTMLERAFDRAQEVKSKQMALTVEQGERDGETEQAFFAGILFQRDQEIRQAIIKRNAVIPDASKKRLAAKRAKADMLGRSCDSSRQGSSDMGTHEDDVDRIDPNTSVLAVEDPTGAESGSLLAAAG